MKLRIDEKDQIVVEPWGSEEDQELREFAKSRVHLDVVKTKMVRYGLKGVQDSPSASQTPRS